MAAVKRSLCGGRVLSHFFFGTLFLHFFGHFLGSFFNTFWRVQKWLLSKGVSVVREQLKHQRNNCVSLLLLAFSKYHSTALTSKKLCKKLCRNISRRSQEYEAYTLSSVLVLAAGVYICLTKYTDLISLLSHLLYMETKLLLSKHTTRINITISLPRPFWNLSAKYLRRHFSDLQIKFHCVYQYRTACFYVFHLCFSCTNVPMNNEKENV